MNYQEYQKRVEHNTKLFTECFANNDSIFCLLDKIYTWEYAPGEMHFSKIMRNAHDIIPSLYLGLLASTENNGADAYEVNEQDEISPVEIKTGEIATNKVWRGTKGGLYVGLENTATKRAAVTSRVTATYTLHSYDNRESKNMRTILMVADTDGPNQYIDALELPGDKVLNYLNLSDNKSRTIKVSFFLNEGWQADTVVPLKGWHNYMDGLRFHFLPFEDWKLREEVREEQKQEQFA